MDVECEICFFRCHMMLTASCIGFHGPSVLDLHHVSAHCSMECEVKILNVLVAVLGGMGDGS